MPESVNRPPMPRPRQSLADRLAVLCDPPGTLRLLLGPWARYLLCWLVTLAVAWVVWDEAWTCWDEPERADGNWGHASIDFGGQWVLGRMIVEGRGEHLYDRKHLRLVIDAHFPDDARNPKTTETDAENLRSWMVGRDDPEWPQTMASVLTPLAAHDVCGEAALLAAGQEVWTEERLARAAAPDPGGSLYPPVHALWFSLIARMPPRLAYRVVQALTLALAFFAGWVIERFTDGRLWWPIATLVILFFPGYAGSINLGQNSMLSLALLLAGWWQLGRGRPVLAGVLWGLLAFKPVWAAVFLLLTLLTGHGRMAVAMMATGAAQIVATLPLVGWRTWREWLAVGQIASADYARQESWIILSRDLLGIPRRWLLTFENGIAVNADRLLPAALGWGAWAVVLGVTVGVALWRRRQVRALSGPAPAFVALGCYFSCYHFMYYDILLAVFPMCLLAVSPMCLLFAKLRQYLGAMFWPGWVRPHDAELLRFYRLSLADLVPPLLLLLLLILPPICFLYDPTHHYPPMDTFCLLLLWAWCGYRIVREPWPVVRGEDGSWTRKQFTELDGDVRRSHEGLADQYSADAGRL